MKNRKFNKLKFGILTVILTLSLLASNILIINAEVGGTGKFLTIDFQGPSDLYSSECKVNATKVSSNQEFTFLAENNGDEANTQRMAAGTILLEAIPADGWIFLGFNSEGELTPNPDDPTGYTAFFKNEKYGVVSASFAIDAFTISASAGSGGSINPSGPVTVDYGVDQTFNIVPTTGYHIVDVLVDDTLQGPISSYTFHDVTADHTIIATFAIDTFTISASAGSGGSINPSGPVTVDYGVDQTFTFTPIEGYHVSAVIIDAGTPGEFYASLVSTGSVETGFTLSYTFPIVTSSHTIHAVFSPDGQASIEVGNNVVVFLSSAVSLNFPLVTEGGTTYGNSLTPVIEGDLIVWSITVEQASFAGGVEVAFQFDPNSVPDTILACHDPNVELFFRSDLDGNGKVDGQDIKIISNLIKHPKFIENLSPDDFNKYNLNADDAIDENDIHVVNSFNGMDYSDFTWEELEITEINELYNVIYGITNGFSLFRCR